MQKNSSCIFLSYARDDDENFAKRLADALGSSQIKVWLDRTSMSSRGLAFLQELRKAIMKSDRVIAICGPAALRSEYVRQEWETAVKCNKQLLPIIRLGEYSDLPPYVEVTDQEYLREPFARQHVPDFRDDNNFDTAFAELLRILSESVPPLGHFFTEPPALPPHHLPRVDLCSLLTESLLSDDISPELPGEWKNVHAIVGMGGIGKSVLAATIVRTSAARRHFHDGVLWLHISRRQGGEMYIVSLIEQAIQCLSGITLQFSNKNSAISELRKLMKDRHYLIVLDNVYDRSIVNIFHDLLGTTSRLLFTTRLVSLATSLGAVIHKVSSLSQSESNNLLRRWIDRDETLTDKAMLVAKRLDNHPLALAMVGASMQNQPSSAWDQLIERFDEEGESALEHEIGNYEYRSVYLAIKISLDWLTHEEDRQHMLSLAIFPSATPLPRKMLFQYLASSGISRAKAYGVVDRLEAASLVKRNSDDTSSLHPLIVDVLKHLVNPEIMIMLHRRWIQGYCSSPIGNWRDIASTGDYDDYFWQYWHMHLNKSVGSEAVVAMLTDLAWLTQLLVKLGFASTMAQILIQQLDEELKIVSRVLTLCGPRVAQSNTDLLFEFLARVPETQQSMRQKLMAKVAMRYEPWVRPLAPGFPSSIDPLIGILNNFSRSKVTNFPNSEDLISSVYLIGDDKLLAVSYDGVVRLWDVASQLRITSFQLTTGRLLSAYVSLDGCSVYWGDDQGKVGRTDIIVNDNHSVMFVPIWHEYLPMSDTEKNFQKSPEIGPLVLAVALVTMYKFTWLVSVTGNGQMQWRDPSTGVLHSDISLVLYTPFTPISLATITCRPDKDGIFIGINDGVHLLIPESDILAHCFGEPFESVIISESLNLILAHRVISQGNKGCSIAITDDDQYLLFSLSNLGDTTGINFVSLIGSNEPNSISLESNGILSLHLTTSGLLLVGHTDPFIDAIDIVNHQHLGRYGVGGGTFSIDSNTDGSLIISGHTDGSVRLWSGVELKKKRGRDTWNHGPIVDMKLARSRSLWYARAQIQLLKRDYASKIKPLGGWSIFCTWLRHVLWPKTELLAFCTSGELSRWSLTSYRMMWSNTLETYYSWFKEQPYSTGRMSADGKLFIGPQTRPNYAQRTNAICLDVWKTSNLSISRSIGTFLSTKGTKNPSEEYSSVAIAPRGDVVVAMFDDDLVVWHTGPRLYINDWKKRWKYRKDAPFFHVFGKEGERLLWQCPQLKFSEDGRWLCLFNRVIVETNTIIGLLSVSDLRTPEKHDLFWERYIVKLRHIFDFNTMRNMSKMRVISDITMDHRAEKIWMAWSFGNVACWHSGSGRVDISSNDSKLLVSCMGLISNERFLLVAGTNNNQYSEVELWDASKLILLTSFTSHDKVTSITAIDGEHFALGYYDGRVCFFSLENFSTD